LGEQQQDVHQATRAVLLPLHGDSDKFTSN